MQGAAAGHAVLTLRSVGTDIPRTRWETENPGRRQVCVREEGAWTRPQGRRAPLAPQARRHPEGGRGVSALGLQGKQRQEAGVPEQLRQEAGALRRPGKRMGVRHLETLGCCRWWVGC